MTSEVIADRYELVAPIGHGAMGEVHRGFDRRLDRPVAVKLLRATRMHFGTVSTAMAERFDRECKVTARVQHPGVPAVYDTGRHGPDLYLVMQLLDGDDLADVIAERSPLPVPWAVAVAAQIASVLDAAHAESLVHRDIKPHNLMLRRDGTLAVLDFGIAALLDGAATRLTRTAETMGTPSYMSPEQATGAPAGPASDLYGLGCVFFELLSGRVPFVAGNAVAMLRMHVDEPAPDVRTLRPEVPDAVADIVADLLAKDPDGRPGSARELYERLVPLLPSQAPAGFPAPGAEAEMDPTRPFRRPLAPAPRRAPGAARPARTAVPAAEPVDLDELYRDVDDLQKASRFMQAVDLLRSGIHRLARQPGAGARIQDLRVNLATTLLLGGDFKGALPEYQSLIADLTAERGSQDDIVLYCRRQAATCLVELGRHGEALRALGALLTDVRRVSGPESEDVFEIRMRIGLALAAAGNAVGARQVFRELLADQRRVLGPDAPQNAELLDLLRHLDDLGLRPA